MWFDIAVCGLTPLLKVNRRPDTHTYTRYSGHLWHFSHPDRQVCGGECGKAWHINKDTQLRLAHIYESCLVWGLFSSCIKYSLGLKQRSFWKGALGCGEEKDTVSRGCIMTSIPYYTLLILSCLILNQIWLHSQVLRDHFYRVTIH